MKPNDPSRNEEKNWESVHICPNCEQVINLADIDLRAITTGIVSCPRCDWAGRIEIKIVAGSDLVPKKDEDT
jgi:hypothetical protein